MKRYKELLLLFAIIFALSSCSDNDSESDDENKDEPVEFKGIQASMGTMETDNGVPQSRAIEDFAVNTVLDPTASMTFRSGWKLDIQIYKGGTPYTDGQATCVLDPLSNTWIPNTTIYFPNYTKQFVSAKLYPTTWQGIVDADQSSEANLQAQDILTQNGANTVTVKPAHIPTIDMKHDHSMLNFIIDKVDESQIAEVKVVVGTVVYTPYKVNNSGKLEYLVILPTSSNSPEIRLKTVGGAEYAEKINIPSTRSNVAYCLHLKGVELILSTISVADWTFGMALSGDYSATTSYPTFQGIPGATYTLYFDNALQQDITFNANGERTIKPVGRTLIKIMKGVESVDVNIILRSMVIDLMPYFPE